MWGISGLLAFYPAYLAMLATHRSAALALSRAGLAPFGSARAYERVPVPR
jgi:hypothetical protein